MTPAKAHSEPTTPPTTSPNCPNMAASIAVLKSNIFALYVKNDIANITNPTPVNINTLENFSFKVLIYKDSF